MRYQPEAYAMFCKGRGKKLDMSSGATGNTSTGDHAAASHQTSQEVVASLRHTPAPGADSNRRTFVHYLLVAFEAWSEIPELNR